MNRPMNRFSPLRSLAVVTFLFGLAVGFLGLAGNALAQEPTLEPAPVSVDPVALAAIQKYLNSVTSIRAKFIQTTSQGGFAEGTLALSRPGKMKIAYAPPNPYEIYADGTWLTYVDYELKEVNQIPLFATPAAVLLSETISFGGKIKVTALKERRGHHRLFLKQAGDEGAGTLILILEKEPLNLRGWAVIDAQQVRTSIVLVKPEWNTAIDPRKLIFDRPDWVATGNSD
jgi:outer membrane lipoprotein-sorting protein